MEIEKRFAFPSNRTGKIIHRGLKINPFLEKFKCNSVILHPAHYCFRATMHNIHIPCIKEIVIIHKIIHQQNGRTGCFVWFMVAFLLFGFGLTEFPLIKTNKTIL